MYPFIKKIKNRLLIKLNKELYSRDLIEEIANQEPNSILSIDTQKNYYLLELNVDGFGDYFDFLNYLIYQNRNK